MVDYQGMPPSFIHFDAIGNTSLLKLSPEILEGGCHTWFSLKYALNRGSMLSIVFLEHESHILDAANLETEFRLIDAVGHEIGQHVPDSGRGV
jgi:hypothetical protein